MPPTTTATPIPPLSSRLSQMVLSLQFLWFVGHLVTAIHAISWIFTGSSTSARSYYKAYAGTLISYGIIVFKGHGVPQLSKTYMMRVVMDENTHYFMLALVWMTCPPVWVTLIPFTIFSVFHSLTYIRTHLLAVLFPQSSSPLSFSRKLSQWIGSFVNTYQTKGLELAAKLEVLFILPYLVLGLFLGKSTVMSIFLFINFLRFRHFFSMQTRLAFTQLKSVCDKWLLHHHATPKPIKKVYSKVVDLVLKYGPVEQRTPANGSSSNPTANATTSQ